VLSGGERARLILARAFARPSNLLVLDEPTNDLDLETLDLLQERLAEYPGTVLLVSHDRDFLDRVQRGGGGGVRAWPVETLTSMAGSLPVLL
jgi:ABC transport system ATP-binding/permease protein